MVSLQVSTLQVSFPCIALYTFARLEWHFSFVLFDHHLRFVYIFQGEHRTSGTCPHKQTCNFAQPRFD